MWPRKKHAERTHPSFQGPKNKPQRAQSSISESPKASSDQACLLPGRSRRNLTSHHECFSPTFSPWYTAPMLAAMKAYRLSLVRNHGSPSRQRHQCHALRYPQIAYSIGKPLPHAAEPCIMPVKNVKNVKPRASCRLLSFHLANHTHIHTCTHRNPYPRTHLLDA
jgi:hypothetical protein